MIDGTVGNLNVVVRMMTDGFKRGVAEVEASLSRMEQAVDGVSGSFDGMMQDAVSSTEDAVKEVNRFTEEVEEANEKVEEMSSVGEAVGGTLGTALEKLSPKFGKLRKAITAVSNTFSQMGNRSKLAVTAVAASIAALAVGFVYQVGKAMYNKMADLVAVANPEVYVRATERLSASLTRLKASLGTVLTPVFDALTLAIQGAVEAMIWWSKNVLAPVYGFMSGLFGATDYIQSYQASAEGIAQSSGEITDNVEEMSRGLAGFDKLDVQSGVKDAKMSAELAAQTEQDMNEIIDRMQDGSELGLTMRDSIGQAIEYIKEMVSPVITKVKELWDGFTQWIDSSGIADFVNGLGGRVQGVFDGIDDWLSSNGVKGFLNEVQNKITDIPEFLGIVWRSVDQWVQSNNVGRFFENLESNIKTIPDMIGQALSGILQMWSNLFDGIGSMFSSLWGWIAQIPNSFVSAITGVLQMWSNLFSGIGNLFNSLWSRIDEIAKWFVSPLASVLQIWSNLFGNVITLFSSLDQSIADIQDKFAIVLSGVLGLWVNLFNNVGAMFNSIDWDGIGKGIVETFSGVFNAIIDVYNTTYAQLPWVEPVQKVGAEAVRVSSQMTDSFQEMGKDSEVLMGRITEGVNEMSVATQTLSSNVETLGTDSSDAINKVSAGVTVMNDATSQSAMHIESMGMTTEDALVRISDGVNLASESVSTMSASISGIAMSADTALARITEGVTSVDESFAGLNDTTSQVWQNNTDSALESFNTITDEIGAVSDALNGIDSSMDTASTVEALDGISEEMDSMFEGINDGMQETADSALEVADAISVMADEIQTATESINSATEPMSGEDAISRIKQKQAEIAEQAERNKSTATESTSSKTKSNSSTGLGPLATAALATFGLTKMTKKLFGLADGGVVEPDNPMLAVLGDNKHEKEAVAPLSSLQSMIDQSVSKAMSANTYGNKGAAHDITLEIDGRELARVSYDYMQAEGKRRGATIARG